MFSPRATRVEMLQLAPLVSCVLCIANLSGSPNIFRPDLYRWSLIFCLSTLTTNTMCTCLIAGRIYWLHRRSASLGRSSGVNLVMAMVLIIESGAIYSVSLAFQMGLYKAGSFGLYIVYNSMPNIVAISFTLLIVRLGWVSVFGNGGSHERTAQFSSVILAMLSNPDTERVMAPATAHACRCERGVDLRSRPPYISKGTTGDHSDSDLAITRAAANVTRSESTSRLNSIQAD